MTGAIDAADAPVRQHRLYWWKEALIISAFYVVYSWIRNRFGSNTIAADGVPEAAFHNAERIIQLERWMGLYHEETVQDWFLPYRWFIQFWNVYYGTAHFFVTLAVFVLLFFKRADVFAQWRNTLAAMTALAIIGFAFFPLMPPRLLDAPCPVPDTVQFGGACVPSELRPGPVLEFDGTNGFGFVDTLSEYGGPWRFDNEEIASISNQYAAMPSLHIGWSTWVALAVGPLLHRRWHRVAVWLYPLATLFCIVVTANHFWLDGVGGLVVFAVGALIGWGSHRWNQNRLDRRDLLDALVAERSGSPRRTLQLGSVASEIIDDVAKERRHLTDDGHAAPNRPDDEDQDQSPDRDRDAGSD
ncbi:MAG: phosphatase PAP2 family protein [Ilumatobacter sp.]